jgi:hypothetical protein
MWHSVPSPNSNRGGQYADGGNRGNQYAPARPKWVGAFRVGPLQRFDQIADVASEVNVTEFKCLPPGQQLQRFRQFPLKWHLRATNQNGNNFDIPSQGRRDLDADEISRRAEADLILIVLHHEPILTNQRDQGITGADFFLDCVDEVTARLKVSDIHKDMLPAKMRTDLIV